MATREIKTKLAVDGLGEYKSAMSDAASSMKVLNSEANLAAAQFKATGDEQQYLADMADILSSKITTQQSAVNAAKSALADLASAGYAENSREVETWQTKLNNAETKLTEYQTALENTQSKLDSFSTGFSSVGDAVEASAEKMGTFNERMAAAEEQYQATGDRQQYLIDKCAALEDAISTQQDVIASAEAALKSLADEGYDENSTEVQEWQQVLADAQSTLTDLTGELTTAQDQLSSINQIYEESSSAIGSAKTAITELDSELKLAEATYTATGDQQQYLADKADILRQKLEEQQSVVSTLEEGLQGLLNAGYDPESDAILQWQTNLNNAKAELINTQTEFDKVQESLTNLDNGLEETSGNAKDTRDSLENIGKQISIDSVLSSLQSIEDKLANIISKAAQAAQALIEVSADSAGWADNLLTEASQYGISQETLQRMRYASKFVDTEVSSFEHAYKRVADKVGDAYEDIIAAKNSDIVQSFAKAGVSVVDEFGQVRDSWDVMWDILTELDTWNKSNREGFISDFFGRNGITEFNPLFDAGVDAYVDKMGEAPVVAEENVQALGSLNDAYDELRSQLEVTKLELVAELAPAFETCATAISELLDKFNGFIQSDEGQAAIDKVTAALENLINTIANEDTIESIFDKITSSVQAISDALTWVLENEQLVKDAALAIGGAFAAIKLSESVLQFMQLVNGAKGLFNLGGGGSGGGGNAVSTAANVAGNAAGAVAGKVSTWGKSLFDGAKNLGTKIVDGAKAALPAIGSALGTAAPWTIVAGGAYLGSRAVDNAGIERMYGDYERAEERLQQSTLDTSNALINQMSDLHDAAQAVVEGSNIDDNALDWSAQQLNQSKEFITQYYDWLSENMADLDIMRLIGQRMEDGFSLDEIFNQNMLNGEDISQGVTDIAERIATALAQASEDGGAELANNYTALIDAATAEAAAAAESGGAEIGASATTAIQTATAEAGTAGETGGQEAGAMVVSGMAGGIDANAGMAIDAAVALANSIVSIIDSAFVIRSPSHVMAEKGKYIAQGLAEGIEDATWMVSDAATQMAGAVNAAPMYTGRSGANGGSYGTGAAVAHVTLVMDEKVVGEAVAPVVDDVIGMEVARR